MEVGKGANSRYKSIGWRCALAKHAKIAGSSGSGGMLPGKFFKIDAEMLQFRDISAYIKYFNFACVINWKGFKTTTDASSYNQWQSCFYY